MAQIPPQFEFDLVASLDPIRGHFLAHVLYFSMSSGLLRAIGDSPHTPTSDVAATLDLVPDRLTGLLDYLTAEGVVTNSTHPDLTSRGRTYLRYEPWYQLLIGGYGTTLGQLPELMKDAATYGRRNDAEVGAGSCGISMYDAVPLVARLLERTGYASTGTLIDLGCGDGTFLMALCEQTGLSGIGVDPATESIETATRTARTRGLDQLVTFHAMTAQDFMPNLHTADGPAYIVAAFALQEVLEQDGRAAVAGAIRQAIANPDSRLIIVEVDHRPSEAKIMHHGLGRAYYNPYYLLHQITEQRLETTEYWLNLIEEAGGRVIAHETVDHRVDSTDLEFGLLVERNEAS